MALDYIRKNWGEQMNRNDFNGAWFENWIPKLGRSKSHAWCAGPKLFFLRSAWN